MLEQRHETRLRHLIGAWSLRATPGMRGQQAELLNENIEAVESALTAALREKLVNENYVQTLDELEALHRRVKHLARLGKPAAPRELTDLADKVEEAISSLKDRL